jgi:hypothetical protein
VVRSRRILVIARELRGPKNTTLKKEVVWGRATEGKGQKDSALKKEKGRRKEKG